MAGWTWYTLDSAVNTISVPYDGGTAVVGEQEIRSAASSEIDFDGGPTSRFNFRYGLWNPGIGRKDAIALRRSFSGLTAGTANVNWQENTLGGFFGYYSEDGGSTWTMLTNGADFTTVATTVDILFVGNDGVDSGADGNEGLEFVVVSFGGTGGSNFSDWIATYAGLGGLTSVGDDPDGDGQDNGVENFFGTNPGEFSAGLVASSASGGTTFTFTHPAGTLADDLTATYRWSLDLESFYDDGVSDGTYTVSFSPVTAGGITTVTATVSGPVGALYVNVKVTQ